MKKRISTVIPMLALTATLVGSLSATAQAKPSAHCSAASVAGKWGFTTTGVIPAVGPVAATGIYTADDSGNIAGSQTRSLNGDVANETFTAKGTVNPDCTGTYVFQVFENGVLVRTSVLNLVFDDNGRETRALFVSIVLPDGTPLPSILTVESRRLFPRD